MKNLVRTVLALLLLTMLAGGYALVAYFTPGSYAETTIVLPPHSGGRAVLTQLHTQGLTPSPLWMAGPLLLTGNMGKLKAGEYHFEPGLSPAAIIARIAHGEIVVHKITVPEGWTVFQVRAALMAEPLLTGALPPVIAEGSLYPDTYRFNRNETRSDILARMQQAQQKNLDDLWKDRPADLPVTTPEAALILASIVERETGVGTERNQVAGVFFNRLRTGMPLQTDPPVAYGIMLARHGAPMDRSLTLADLKQDNPYNSYTRVGLPPTPICNPGREALVAVLHPAATDALYFVATGHGGHVFSNTLEEHTRHVAEYRAVERQKLLAP